MTKLLFPVFALAFIAAAADKKFLPNQAGDDDVDLKGTVLLTRAEVQQALGVDLGQGYVAVKITVTPKTGKPFAVSPDNFTMISRKDGERSTALTPSQIAGKSVLVVHPAARQPSGLGTVSSGPIWGGIGGARPRQLPGNNNGVGNSSSVESGTADATVGKEKGDTDTALMEALKAKGLGDIETKDEVSGLLYFALEGKVKPKDVSLLYKGPNSRLVIDFK